MADAQNDPEYFSRNCDKKACVSSIASSKPTLTIQIDSDDAETLTCASRKKSTRICGMRRKTFWICLGIISFSIGLALGLGLGLTIGKRPRNHDYIPSISPTDDTLSPAERADSWDEISSEIEPTATEIEPSKITLRTSLAQTYSSKVSSTRASLNALDEEIRTIQSHNVDDALSFTQTDIFITYTGTQSSFFTIVEYTVAPVTLVDI